MSLYVQKFGGTSVASPERIAAVAERVHRTVQQGHRVAVVASAMGGETDRLSDLASTVQPTPEPRELDVLLASGEQASIALLTMALCERQQPARSYLADQITIRTDASFNRARVEHIEREHLSRELDQGIVPVIAGFQGVTSDGGITTLGRGGSDTTAVAVAVALAADECQIYTDVDGVYTSDPRVVPDARLLTRLTFEEMLEMASLGSAVLHPRAVAFAGKYEIPVRVLSSFGAPRAAHDPSARQALPGTLITYEESIAMEAPVISGIAFARDAAKITVQGVPDVPGVASSLLGPVGKRNVEIDMIVQNVGANRLTDFTFSVARSDCNMALEAVGSAASQLGAGAVSSDERIAKISLVGVGMRSHAGVATRMFDALAAENINIQMISTSEIKISVVIAEKYLELAVRALHDAFGLATTADETN